MLIFGAETNWAKLLVSLPACTEPRLLEEPPHSASSFMLSKCWVRVNLGNCSQQTAHIPRHTVLVLRILVMKVRLYIRYIDIETYFKFDPIWTRSNIQSCHIPLWPLEYDLPYERCQSLSRKVMMESVHQTEPVQKCPKDLLLKRTFSPLKMAGWTTTFPFGRPIFKGYVSFREGIAATFQLVRCMIKLVMGCRCFFWEGSIP